MKVRIFRRQSDGEIKMAQLEGPGVWPKTADEDFTKLFGTFESYDLDELTDPAFPALGTKEVTMDGSNNASFVGYTQVEADGFPKNLLKKYIEEAKQGLLDATTVADIQKHTCVLNGVCKFGFIQAAAEIV